MRVTFNTIDEFLTDLQNESPERVFQKAVRVQYDRQPIQGDRRSAVKFQIAIQVSAIITTEDGGEYIMEAAEDCGFDYRDASQEFAGTEKADELKRMIEDHCGHHGLVVRPGAIVE